jgi:uncharacterized RmlC-like cupin family protein
MTRSADEQTHPHLHEQIQAPEQDEPSVRVVRPSQFDSSTAQTPGMQRFAAISGKLTGSKGMWAGLTLVDPTIESAPHHHGEQETVIYVKSGYALIRWGDQLQHEEQVEPGAFIFIPPYLPHQEINPSSDTVSEWVIVRNGSEGIVVNLTIPPQGSA